MIKKEGSSKEPKFKVDSHFEKALKVKKMFDEVDIKETSVTNILSKPKIKKLIHSVEKEYGQFISATLHSVQIDQVIRECLTINPQIIAIRDEVGEDIDKHISEIKKDKGLEKLYNRFVDYLKESEKKMEEKSQQQEPQQQDDKKTDDKKDEFSVIEAALEKDILNESKQKNKDIKDILLTVSSATETMAAHVQQWKNLKGAIGRFDIQMEYLTSEFFPDGLK